MPQYQICEALCIPPPLRLETELEQPMSSAPPSSSELGLAHAAESETLIPRPAPIGYSSDKATLMALRNDLNRLGTSVKTVDCTLPSNRTGVKCTPGVLCTDRGADVPCTLGLHVDITAFLLAPCHSL